MIRGGRTTLTRPSKEIGVLLEGLLKVFHLSIFGGQWGIEQGSGTSGRWGEWQLLEGAAVCHPGPGQEKQLGHDWSITKVHWATSSANTELLGPFQCVN